MLNRVVNTSLVLSLKFSLQRRFGRRTKVWIHIERRKVIFFRLGENFLREFLGEILFFGPVKNPFIEIITI